MKPWLCLKRLLLKSTVQGPETSASPGSSKCLKFGPWTRGISITWELKVQTLKSHCNSLSLSSSSAFPQNQITEGFVYILKLEAYRDNILHFLLKSSGQEEPQPTAGLAVTVPESILIPHCPLRGSATELSQTAIQCC